MITISIKLPRKIRERKVVLTKKQKMAEEKELKKAEEKWIHLRKSRKHLFQTEWDRAFKKAGVSIIRCYSPHGSHGKVNPKLIIHKNSRKKSSEIKLIKNALLEELQRDAKNQRRKISDFQHHALRHTR